MEVESSICLSDLIPALRWSRPQQVAEALGDPRLPAGWWSSLPLSKALGTAGLDWICDRLAKLAVARWDHLPLADLLPALTVHPIDPALPGWSEATRTAVTGLGGWQRLRRLSPSDLSTPSATPEVVIGSVLREILGRIPAHREIPVAAGHPEVTRPLQRDQMPVSARGTGTFPAVGPDGTPQSRSAFTPSEANPSGPQPTGPFAGQGQGQGDMRRPAPGQSGAFPVPSAADGGPRSTGSFPAPPSSESNPRQPGVFPAPTSTDSPSRSTGSFPAAEGGPRQTGSFPAVPGQDNDPRQSGAFPSPPSAQGNQRQTGSFPAVPSSESSPRQSLFPAPPSSAGNQRHTGSFPAVPPAEGNPRQTGSFPAVPPTEGNPRQTGSFPAVPSSEGNARQSGAFPGPSSPERSTGSFAGQPQTGSFSAQPQSGANPRQGLASEGGLPQRPAPGQSERLPQRPSGPQSGRQDAGGPAANGPHPGSGGPHTGSIPPVPGTPPSQSTPGAPGAPGTGIPGTGAPAAGTPGAPGTPGAAGPGAGTPGSANPAGLPGAANPAAGLPGAANPAAGLAGAGNPVAGLPAAGTPGAGIPGSAARAAAGTPAGPSGAPSAPAPSSPPSASGSTPRYPAGTSPVPSDTDHAMVRVVDNLFRSLDKLELAVAVHRLFAEDPVSLRTLAHKMLVERDALSQAQRTAEERVLHWLRSSESAPVTGHMFRLTEWLGAAATEDQLIGADPAHPVTVPSLRTPLWRVLVTLMPDRRFQDGWLVVGDLHGLQSRTRQLLASSPPDTDLVELMGELGIRAHSAKAWLDALPPETGPDPVAAASSPAQPLPRRTPGANGHHHRGGQPIPSATAGAIDPSAALATLSALSGGRSPMLPGLAGAPATPPPPLPGPNSDPRRWQRIEVTPEHLRGGPVPVPEGYAAQLGMRPGTLLSVTGPGDNAIVLVWQGHQPVFDSLQPVLMRLNARPGDQVYVTVDGYRLEAQLTG
ncbi:hypothetical protein [Nonomuraea fuscirosea]|uniref:hypothetical protein n=1 Tax=Nonomuraea fuscirosea TaxID=1291556 RepID=UPI0033C87982